MVWGTIAASAISGGLNYLGQRSANKSAESIFQQNAALQREFAQKGIRWRVEDAKAAGIHPLYAMGASIPTYSPSSVSFGNTMKGFADASQNIGRAIDATRTSEERREHERDMRLIERERAAAEIRLLNAQAGAANRANNPPLPSVVKDPTDAVEQVGRSNAAQGILPGESPPNWIIGSGMTGEDAEQEYGEAIGGLYGAFKFGHDLNNNTFGHVRRYARRRAMEHFRKQRPKSWRPTAEQVRRNRAEAARRRGYYR